MKHQNEQSNVQAGHHITPSAWATRLALGIPTVALPKPPRQPLPDRLFRSRSIDLCV